mgnify:CR=1 FL=1
MKVRISAEKRKTVVNTGEKGELQVNVSPKNLITFKKRGWVRYSDFGARGDGKTDDIDAIAATHAVANQYELSVKADKGATYYIGGKERNYQTDEAYLMLGKARYYSQRFVPALDAFNYILYKHPHSDKIYEAKIWREKTNMRLGNDAIVVKNINQLLKKTDLNKQTFSDANALLAEAFLNLEERDSAVAKLRIAEEFSRINEDRARYKFILGQMYQEVGNKDSAAFYYDGVIDMNRKADRKYMMHAYAKKAQMYDYENGNDTIFLKTYNKLVADRENRPYLDVLFYEMGVFFDKNDEQQDALVFYNKSLGRKSKDPYLIASTYRNIGDMYFKNTNYTIAAKYYDSTLVKLDPKSREFAFIEKNRKNIKNYVFSPKSRYLSLALRV